MRGVGGKTVQVVGSQWASEQLHRNAMRGLWVNVTPFVSSFRCLKESSSDPCAESSGLG